MALRGTKFWLADNSGARLGKCIGILGKNNRGSIKLGNFILFSVINFYNQHRLKKRDLYIGLVILLSRWNSRKDGLWIRFVGNRALTFSRQFKFIGSRVYGGMAIEVRLINSRFHQRVCQKVISYSGFLI